MRKKKRKGLMGLGALILFIAIILIVGVIAIVLITSGGSLQQKSTLKQREAKKGVSSGLEVISVIGSDARPSGPTPHQLTNLHLMVRLLPGTSSINLNSTLIYYENNGRGETVLFNTSCDSTCNAVTTGTYMVYYLKNGTHHEMGYINLGDVAKLAIKVNQPVAEDQTIRLSIIPSFGPQTVIKILTPNTMVRRMVTIWPTSS